MDMVVLKFRLDNGRYRLVVVAYNCDQWDNIPLFSLSLYKIGRLIFQQRTETVYEDYNVAYLKPGCEIVELEEELLSK
jgi:hypothetical protein